MRDSFRPVNSRKSVTLPVFGLVEAERIIARDKLFVVIRDKYPVSNGHCLIIPRRNVARFQELTPREEIRMLRWAAWTQNYLLATLLPIPDAFNLGINDGQAAGQTMEQFHFHIIPRYRGDVHDPRGGIRWVIPRKARYWQVS